MPVIATRRYPASRKLSAVSRSTDTSCETPRSAMVTPKRRLMRAMVMGLWVITMKRVSVVPGEEGADGSKCRLGV